MEVERLYYTDSYRTAFEARVLETGADGRRVVLDRTAFYPASGGQPHDLGRIAGAQVEDVIDEDDRIVHVLSAPIVGSEVSCEVDWPRRFDHMQQHTGQHLISAVFAELFEFPTVSFHMGLASSTIDLGIPALSIEQIREAEARANDLVFENRPVRVTVEDAAEAFDLRKPSERTGPLRIVSIQGLDRSACGGTHVRSTGEIGSILLRSTEKIRRNVRLEFLCGGRAIRQARADYDALEKAARTFSSSLDDVPALVAAQAERLKDAEKLRRRLEGELAESRGRALYSQTTPDPNGRRVHIRMIGEGAFPEDLRSEAIGFVSQNRAVFAGVAPQPPSVMIAASADSQVHAGDILKAVMAELGGRGGGSAQFAQGSFTAEPKAAIERLRALLGE